MKIQFSEPDKAQAPVRAAQAEVRGAKRRPLPILGSLFIMALLAAGAYALYLYMNWGAVHSYGIVRGQLFEMRAPARATVKKFDVRGGQRVAKGQPLFTLIATENAPDLHVAEANASGLRQQLKTIESGAELPGSFKAEGLREQRAIAAAMSDLEGQLARLRKKNQEAAAVQQHSVARAELEVAKLTSFHAMRKSRHQKLVELYNADAAVISEVRTALNGMQLAEKNLEGVRLDLDLARKRQALQTAGDKKEVERLEKRLAALSPQMKASEALYASMSGGAGSSRASRISALKAQLQVAIARVEKFRKMVGETHCVSPCDGVVTDVAVAPGTAVSLGEVVMRVSSSEDTWVDAYVPARLAGKLADDAQVTVYPADGSSALQGRLLGGASQEVRIPAVLDLKMPRQTTATQARVQLPRDARWLLPGSVVRLVVR